VLVCASPAFQAAPFPLSFSFSFCPLRHRPSLSMPAPSCVLPVSVSRQPMEIQFPATCFSVCALRLENKAMSTNKWFLSPGKKASLWALRLTNRKFSRHACTYVYVHMYSIYMYIFVDMYICMYICMDIYICMDMHTRMDL
jgi:hypothetical protein